jgi:hypothetical protein
MSVELVVAGDWAGAQLSDVKAVAQSVVEQFPSIAEPERLHIRLEPTASSEDSPIALFARGAAGEYVVRLPVRGNLWARLAFQFAHEYCHVLANPETLVNDRFLWLEEALCETGSLFALRRMAAEWHVNPPYENWREYAIALDAYAAERMSEREHCLPPGARLSEWLAARLPELERDPGLREDLVIIAKELLPLFMAEPAGWYSVRALHAWPRSASATLSTFLESWRVACVAPQRGLVTAINDLLLDR